MIEIRIGSGEPQCQRIIPGEPMGPLLVGTSGAWMLSAPGVAAEHAEFYFDGAQLFLRSVDMVAPTMVNGQAVLGVWTPLDPSSEVLLGGARLWFGPDPSAGGYASMNHAQLLEDDDNVATRVADQAQENAWGDVSEMVRRGMEISRSRAPEPAIAPLPPPSPAFWPAAEPSAAPPHEEHGGPSTTKRTDDSGMTKIEPVENVERRREVSMAGRRFGDPSMSGSNYPNAAYMSGAAPLTTSGSNYPNAAHMSGAAPLATPGSNYPSAAHMSGAAPLTTSGSNYPSAAHMSGAAPLGFAGNGYPSVAHLSGAAPLTTSGSNYPSAAHLSGAASLISSQSNPPQGMFGQGGGPAAMSLSGGLVRTEVLGSSPMPSFGAPPSLRSFGAPPSTAPSAMEGAAMRQTGTYQQVASPMLTQSARLEQSTTAGDAERAAQKSAWQALSGPKKALVFLSPLIVAAAVVLFLGDELGLQPPPRSPQAAAQTGGAPKTTNAAPPGDAPQPSAVVDAEPPSPAPTAAGPSPSSGPDTDTPVARNAGSSKLLSPTAAPADSSSKTEASKTLQRLAADAVAGGAYGRAAELYQKLAKEHPNKPAYAEAAEIMRVKAGLR
ncbi:FHA domain-containing protein [Chondromyces crocatus]|nr:FHA domain-containing protein [Chondromyces crocatus]